MRIVKHDVQPALVPGMIQVTVICPECKKRNVIECSEEGYRRWEGGETINRALPELTADQREQLITGIDQKCWDEMFKPEDDEEQPDEEA